MVDGGKVMKLRKASFDSLLSRLAWINHIESFCHNRDYVSVDATLWRMTRETLEELTKFIGGAKTREMLSGRVSPERRAKRRRLLDSRLVHPFVTGKNQYVVAHAGLFKLLNRGGFETVRDLVSVDHGTLYRLPGLGRRCKEAFNLILMDLLKQDLRIDLRVGNYHIGQEPDVVEKCKLAPLAYESRELADRKTLLCRKVDELFNDKGWKSGKRYKLIRVPERSTTLYDIGRLDR